VHIAMGAALDSEPLGATKQLNAQSR